MDRRRNRKANQNLTKHKKTSYENSFIFAVLCPRSFNRINKLVSDSLNEHNKRKVKNYGQEKESKECRASK